MSYNFKIGDKVKVISTAKFDWPNGITLSDMLKMTGKIIGFNDRPENLDDITNDTIVNVCWDKLKSGHLGGYHTDRYFDDNNGCKNNSGWAVPAKYIKKAEPKYSKHIAQLNFDESLNEDKVPDEIYINVSGLKDNQIKSLRKKLESLGFIVDRKADGISFEKNISSAVIGYNDEAHLYLSKTNLPLRGDGNPYYNYVKYDVKKLLSTRKQPHYVAQLNFDEGVQLNTFKKYIVDEAIEQGEHIKTIKDTLYIVATKTNDEFVSLQKILFKNGYKWNSGDHIKDKSAYGKKTALMINIKRKRISYGEADYFKEDGYNVLSYDEFIKMMKMDSDYIVNEAIEQGQGPDIDTSKYNEICINIKSKEENTKIQEWAFAHNFTWASGTETIYEYPWRDYGKNSIIHIIFTNENFRTGKMYNGDISYFRKLKIPIIKYKEFMEAIKYDKRIKNKEK